MSAYSIFEMIFGLFMIGYGTYYGFFMNSEKTVAKSRRYKDAYTSGNEEEKAQALQKFKNNQRLVGILFILIGAIFIIKQFFL